VVEGVCDICSLEPPTRPQQPREKLLPHFKTEGEVFFSYIVPVCENSVCHFEPESKRHSMLWHHQEEKIHSLPPC